MIFSLILCGIIVAYLVVSWQAFSFLRDGDRGRILVIRKVTIIALAVHFCYFIARSISLGGVCVVSVRESLVLFSFLIVIMTLLLKWWTKNYQAGIYTIPVAALFLITSLFFPATVNPDIFSKVPFDSPVFFVHVAFTLAGFAGLVIAVVLSLVHFQVSLQLKRGSMSRWLSAQPGKPEIFSQMGAAIQLGSVALSVGLLLGFIAAHKLWQDEHTTWWLDAKVVSSIIIWILMLGMTVLYRLRKVSQRVFPILTVATFIVVLVSIYIASHTSVVHDFVTM